MTAARLLPGATDPLSESEPDTWRQPHTRQRNRHPALTFEVDFDLGFRYLVGRQLSLNELSQRVDTCGSQSLPAHPPPRILNHNHAHHCA